MRETNGDLWAYLGTSTICITTNGTVSRRGKAVLGRGCARRAGELFPDLAQRLGALILSAGNLVHELGDGLVSFPVEETAWSNPDLRLIASSARQLVALADSRGWGEIVVPRPGCGGGGLSWQEVRPVLEALLDDRFLLVTLA